MSDIRRIAEEIAEGVTNQEYHNRKLADRIEKALRDRDERAVRTIEQHRLQDVCRDNRWTTIKAAIRKED